VKAGGILVKGESFAGRPANPGLNREETGKGRRETEREGVGH